MERRIQGMFAAGHLDPRSELDEVPFIGPYLYDRMVRTFNPRRPRLTIRQFADAVRNHDRATLIDRIKRALQNDRANMCVRNPHPYHIADVNTMGWIAIVSLLRVLGRGRDGHNMGARFAFDARRLALPTARENPAKKSGCISRRDCAYHRGMLFHDGLCMPRSSRARGFDRIGRQPGQKSSTLVRRARGSRYARHPSGRASWRHASRRRQRRLPMR